MYLSNLEEIDTTLTKKLINGNRFLSSERSLLVSKHFMDPGACPFSSFWMSLHTITLILNQIYNSVMQHYVHF